MVRLATAFDPAHPRRAWYHDGCAAIMTKGRRKGRGLLQGAPLPQARVRDEFTDLVERVLQCEPVIPVDAEVMPHVQPLDYYVAHLENVVCVAAEKLISRDGSTYAFFKVILRRRVGDLGDLITALYDAAQVLDAEDPLTDDHWVEKFDIIFEGLVVIQEGYKDMQPQFADVLQALIAKRCTLDDFGLDEDDPEIYTDDDLDDANHIDNGNANPVENANAGD